MKNIYKILLLTGLMLSSCDKDLLEPFTPGALTEEIAIANSGDLQKVMNATYNNLTNREDIVFSSVFTDEVGIGIANGGQGINDNFIFYMDVSSFSPTQIWQTTYYTLARANRVITFSNKITPINSADAELISRLKAEALTIRALCHLKLMAYFSTDLKNDNALAAVLADKVITAADPGQPRATNGQFYTSIHNDLNDALTIFNSLTTSPYSGVTTSYYSSKNLAKALKARAYAYKGDYTNAETWADDVINNSGISLATFSNYKNVFHTDNEPANTEVIFRLRRTPAQNSQATNLHNGWNSVNNTVTGSSFFEIGRSLFNVLNTNPTDVRYSTIVAPSSVIDPSYTTSANYRATDKLILQKHGGTTATTSGGGFNSDHKIVRLSEMYLIKAEARANANDLVGAATAIKSILDKRFSVAQTLPVYANQTAAWKAILDQRRIEFAFEGYRFIDLKRLGTLAAAGIDRDPADYSSASNNFPGANPANLPLTSNKWALPIPQEELNANPSIQQNPGY